jgi:hypothetical protein
MLKFTPKAVGTENPHYDPEALMDTLMRILGARNDRKLADRLSVQPSQICKIRKRSVPVSSALLICMHEETGLSLRQLRALMGDYREHTGPSANHPVLPQLQYINGFSSLHALPNRPSPTFTAAA